MLLARLANVKEHLTRLTVCLCYSPLLLSDSTSSRPSLTLTDLQPYALQLAKLLLPLGSVLGVPDYAMAVQLEVGSTEDKCLRVLQRWLEHTPEPTWEAFYKKLRQPGLDMHNLAVQIARKHCPHML